MFFKEKTMSGTTLRFIIAAVLIFHGIGHAMGVLSALPLLKKDDESQAGFMKNWSSDSWLLTDALGKGVTRVTCIVLYALALIGFIVTGLSLLDWVLPHDWWRTAAIVSSAISLLALALHWNALMLLFPHKIGAIAINVATLVCLLGANWPAETDIGF